MMAMPCTRKRRSLENSNRFVPVWRHWKRPVLQEARAQHSLQTMITYAPEAFVLLDIETGRFLEANPMAEQLFGLPRAALLEMGPIELSPPYQPDGPSSTRGNEKIAEAVGGGVPVFEWWHCNARGERIPCEIRLVKSTVARSRRDSGYASSISVPEKGWNCLNAAGVRFWRVLLVARVCRKHSAVLCARSKVSCRG